MSDNRYVLPSNVTPSHYQLQLTPDFNLLTFDGLEVINVNITGKQKKRNKKRNKRKVIYLVIFTLIYLF